MSATFFVVMVALEWMATLTGFTYAEINIIAYFMILPLLYAAMIDGIMRGHWLKLVVVAGWAVALLVIPDFGSFSEGLFGASVTFLLQFEWIGLDYTAAAVVVCVILQGFALAGLGAWWAISVRAPGLGKTDLHLEA